MIYSEVQVSVEESGAHISLLCYSQLCVLTRQDRRGKTGQMISFWEAGWLLKVNCFIYCTLRHPGVVPLSIGPLKASGSNMDDASADHYKDTDESFHPDGPHDLLEGNEEEET